MLRRTCFQGHPPALRDPLEVSWERPAKPVFPESFLWPSLWPDPKGLNCSAIFRVVFHLTRSSAHAHRGRSDAIPYPACWRKCMTVCYPSHSINVAFCVWLTDWPMTRRDQDRAASHWNRASRAKTWLSKSVKCFLSLLTFDTRPKLLRYGCIGRALLYGVSPLVSCVW